MIGALLSLFGGILLVFGAILLISGALLSFFGGILSVFGALLLISGGTILIGGIITLWGDFQLGPRLLTFGDVIIIYIQKNPFRGQKGAVRAKTGPFGSPERQKRPNTRPE